MQACVHFKQAQKLNRILACIFPDATAIIYVMLESCKARSLNRALADICSEAAARNFAVLGEFAIRILYSGCKSLCCVKCILRGWLAIKESLGQSLIFTHQMVFFLVLNPARYYWHYADIVLETMEMSFLFRRLWYSSSNAVTILERQQHLRLVSCAVGSLKDPWY